MLAEIVNLKLTFLQKIPILSKKCADNFQFSRLPGSSGELSRIADGAGPGAAVQLFRPQTYDSASPQMSKH